jgi:hypothetical protein
LRILGKCLCRQADFVALGKLQTGSLIRFLFHGSGKKAFPDAKRYTIVADPERKSYAAWGVGSLGWGGMVNGGVMEALKSLKESDGIDLRPTGVGSYRWQNSGGFAVDGEGKIRWRKIAKDSSDMCDYAEAAETIQSRL